jgi:hypothetical protein
MVENDAIIAPDLLRAKGAMQDRDSDRVLPGIWGVGQ